MFKKKKYIGIFIFLVGINTFFDIIEPKFAQKLIDKALNSSPPKELLYLGIIWLAIFTIKYINKYIFQNLSLKFKTSVIEDIEKYLFDHFLKLPISYFQNNSIGYIVSRQLDDAFSIDGIMIYNIIEGFFSIVQVIVIFIIMFNTNVLLGALSLILTIGDVVINFCFPLKELYKKLNEEVAILRKELSDTFLGIKLIKMSNKFRYEIQRFSGFLKGYFNALLRRENVNIIRRLVSSLLKELSNPIIIIIGGFLIYYNKMSVGTLTLFIIYFGKLSVAFYPATNLIPLFKISKAYAERIYEIISMDIEENCATNDKLEFKNLVEFKNVSFSYDGNTNVLNNINIKINKNQFVAFVGKSGSGKSSILNLILKIFLPSSGNIYIDGQDIKEINTSTLRNSISYVDQSAFLFNRSLYENLNYSSTDKVTEEFFTKTLNETSLTPIISKMPNGIDTLITEDGNNLSGGEKQRICIAREMLKNCNILILDEYTSALDSITESKIQNTLNSISKDKTVIMVAHKLPIIKNADNIFVLNEGNIVESGNHEELMNKKGLYFSLYNQQISNNN